MDAKGTPINAAEEEKVGRRNWLQPMLSRRAIFPLLVRAATAPRRIFVAALVALNRLFAPLPASSIASVAEGESGLAAKLEGESGLAAKPVNE